MRANNNPNALVTNVDNISNNNRDNMELVERYAITHTETNGKNKRWLQSESDSINKPFNEEAQRLNIVDGSNTQIQNRVEKFGMSENNNLKSKKTPVTRTAAYTKGRKNSQRRGKKNDQGRAATNQQPTSFVPAKRHLDITAPEITEIGFHSSSRKYIRSGINDHPTDQRGINCVPIAVAHTVNYYSPATDVHTSTDIYGNVIGPLTLDDAKESLKRKNIDFAQSDLDIKNIDANIKNSNAKSGIILFSREREMGHAVHIRVLNGKVHITDDQRSGRIATRQQPTGVDLECYLNQNSANGKVIFLDTDQINCLNNSFSRVSLVDQHSDYMDIGYGSGKKCDPNGVKITIAEQFNVNPNNSLIRDNMEYVERYARNPKLNKIIEITEKSKPQDIPGNADVRIHALKGNLEGLNSVDIKKDTSHMPQHQQNPGNARLLFIYKNSKIKWLGVGDTHGDNVKEWDQIEKDNATSGYLCFTNKKNNIKYGIKKVKL